MPSRTSTKAVALKLLEAGADPCIGTAMSPLETAIKLKLDAVIQALLEAGAAVGNNSRDRRAFSDYVAATLGRHYTSKKPINVFRAFLAAGADPSIPSLPAAGPDVPSSQAGRHVLHSTVLHNDEECTLALLKHGVDANARTFRGETPLLLAAKGGHGNFIRLLLEHGADPNIAASDKVTPLHDASQLEDAECVRLLLEAGAVQVPGPQGSFPLHLAAADGRVEAAVHLLRCGADVNAQNRNHKTPLMLAAGHRPTMPDMLNLLIEAGAHLNDVDVFGKSALHEACKVNMSQTVRTLLAAWCGS
jgi:ankyrin repeat protein